MVVLGFLAAVLIGVSLGLIGGGGSILTVPVLVYILAIDPVLATAYSLFVVGVSALIGSFDKYRKKLVSLKTAVVFAVPSLLAVYLTRMYLVPAIPETIIDSETFSLTKGTAIMAFFAVIMLVASISMIRSKNSGSGKEEQAKSEPMKIPFILLEGAVVGVLTGVVGAGGGFLIIPALVLFGKLPMKMAVGTSLLIIAVKSLMGFVGDIQSGQPIEWSFLLLFTLCSVIGIFVGGYLSKFISGQKLKKGFGWFVLVMAVYIMGKEILFK